VDALEVRVDDERGHGDRPQPPDDGRQLVDGNEEHDERGEREKDDLPGPEGSARELATRGARVPGVDTRVDEPVQRHRETPRADHCHRHPEEVVRAWNAVHREERADVRERKREDGVLHLDERGEEARIAESGFGHV
jgi:hypothetical protein